SRCLHILYLYCFFFFRRASRRAIWIKETFFFLFFSLLLVLANGFNLVRFLTNSFRSVLITCAVASRVSLSALGFLCSFSIFLNVSSSPLKG
uniref:Uncharacterized protein n=1 Tax=Myripristis murdjan TaxID=586833 RepID=A0A667X3Y0_9TELE